MNVLLLVLLFGSLIFSLALIAPMLSQRRRHVRRTAGVNTAVAAGQLLLGALWILYGALYLRDQAHSRVAGIYLVIFGLLWCWQGIRRLAARRRA